MKHRVDAGRSAAAVAIAFGIHAVIGVVGYFVAFLFAYGFRENITAFEHLLFLAFVAILAAVAAAISAPVIKAALGLAWRQALTLALSLNALAALLVVGLGSIISALNKDQGSVSAEFSTTTDVVVAGCLLSAALVAGWVSWRSLPRAIHSRA